MRNKNQNFVSLFVTSVSDAGLAGANLPPPPHCSGRSSSWRNWLTDVSFHFGRCVVTGLAIGVFSVSMLVAGYSAYAGSLTPPPSAFEADGVTPKASMHNLSEMASKTTDGFNRDTDSLEAISDRVGTANPGSAGTDTIFNYLKKIFDQFASLATAANQTTLLTRTGASTDAASSSGTSLFALLKYLVTAPGVTSAGGDATAANQTDMMGATFVSSTDSLESIRDAVSIVNTTAQQASDNSSTNATRIGTATSYTGASVSNIFSALQDIRDNVTPASIGTDGVITLYVGGDLKPENVKFGKTVLGVTGVLTSQDCPVSITDSRDGRSYDTELIGTQCWMKKNLNVGSMLASGATMPTNNATIEKWCYSNSSAICDTDGGLYHWDEAMSYSTTEGAQGICMAGWHIPTHAEWTALERAVCTSGTCATDFPYDTTTTGWRGTNEGSKLSSLTLNGTNSSGFSGILTDHRDTDSNYYHRGSYTNIWSSSESGSSAWSRYLYSGYSTVYRSTNDKAYGFSVRCLRD